MTAIETLTFEQAYKELADLIQQLESGELPLAESVTLYERGRALSERCQHLLDQAELRVKKLADNGEMSDHPM